MFESNGAYPFPNQPHRIHALVYDLVSTAVIFILKAVGISGNQHESIARGGGETPVLFVNPLKAVPKSLRDDTE